MREGKKSPYKGMVEEERKGKQRGKKTQQERKVKGNRIQQRREYDTQSEAEGRRRGLTHAPS